jgi:hypothetical protein
LCRNDQFALWPNQTGFVIMLIPLDDITNTSETLSVAMQSKSNCDRYGNVVYVSVTMADIIATINTTQYHNKSS